MRWEVSWKGGRCGWDRGFYGQPGDAVLVGLPPPGLHLACHVPWRVRALSVSELRSGLAAAIPYLSCNHCLEPAGESADSERMPHGLLDEKS